MPEHSITRVKAYRRGPIPVIITPRYSDFAVNAWLFVEIDRDPKVIRFDSSRANVINHGQEVVLNGQLGDRWGIIISWDC